MFLSFIVLAARGEARHMRFRLSVKREHREDETLLLLVRDVGRRVVARAPVTQRQA